MMTTIDEQLVHAPADICFDVAADVERWPVILPHYRWVRFHDKRSFGEGVVEMSAWRAFPAGINYPTWWVSEMHVKPDEPAVYYRHIDGVTRGMDVKWEFQPRGSETFIRIVHTWDGPAWPLIRGIAANLVIGPHFVSAIAQRTLAGVARESESRVSGRT
jgi:hypothetical protein